MTSINAGGAFYRVQNSLNQNSEDVSKSMQRLASGRQNIAPGDRTASSSVAWGMKAEAASLKIGIQNGTEALQAVEMVNNDVQTLQSSVVRLEELHALGTNSFNTASDTAALTAEATKIIAEMTRITTSAEWKGNDIIGTSNSIGFGRNGGTLDVTLTAFTLPKVQVGTWPVGAADFAVGGVTKIDNTPELASTISGKTSGQAGYGVQANYSGIVPNDGVAVYRDMYDTPETATLLGSDVSSGNSYTAAALLSLKQTVDAMAIDAGALYNRVTNTMSHLGSLNAGYALDVASKMDVDFAGETTELAKGQILAQAGTAMLAQANAQGQGMLALIQS
ncbi:flagellin [Planktomarina temperata]|nr:flagellin [Planktomarina temperata]